MIVNGPIKFREVELKVQLVECQVEGQNSTLEWTPLGYKMHKKQVWNFLNWKNKKVEYP